jgi:hypothetical protein
MSHRHNKSKRTKTKKETNEDGDSLSNVSEAIEEKIVYGDNELSGESEPEGEDLQDKIEE